MLGTSDCIWFNLIFSYLLRPASLHCSPSLKCMPSCIYFWLEGAQRSGKHADWGLDSHRAIMPTQSMLTQIERSCLHRVMLTQIERSCPHRAMLTQIERSCPQRAIMLTQGNEFWEIMPTQSNEFWEIWNSHTELLAFTELRRSHRAEVLT